MKRQFCISGLVVCLAALLPSGIQADPCGMVPPIYEGDDVPIARVGRQKTFVFFKDGLETFVIRPGFSGKVDEFGMLIPFPTIPAIRKVPDNIFSQIAAAIDPPEVVVDLRMFEIQFGAFGDMAGGESAATDEDSPLKFDEVRVVKQEAVGMYEVAVLEAGSAQALKRWVDDHGFTYPDGMDEACDDYVDLGWCFVAVKTRVGQKAGVDPKPGARDVDSKLPADAVFDGNVQAMGFRFKVEELVVPMRLSAFNEGELHNVVYLLTDQPQRIDSIDTGTVVRQISGENLYNNVTKPLPLRIIGGDYDDIPQGRKESLKQERNPVPHNGLARELFAADLLAVRENRLSHPHEETEKQLLNVGERLGLRGKEVDRLNMEEIKAAREKVVEEALSDLKSMTLTVIDGDFPRDLLAEENLTFTSFEMDAEKNTPAAYDARLFGPSPQAEGTRFIQNDQNGGITILEKPEREAAVVVVRPISWALFAAAGLLVVLSLVTLLAGKAAGGAR